LKKLFLITTLLLALLPHGSVAAQEVDLAPSELKTSPVLITGYQVYDGGFDFIQIYNTSSEMISLKNWTIAWEIKSPDNEITAVKVPLQSWLPRQEYAIIAEQSAVDDADLEYQPTLNNGEVVSLKIIPPPDLHATYATKDNLFGAGRYAMEATSAGNFTSSRPFKLVDNYPLYGGGLYAPPKTNSLQIVEILANSRHCSPQESDSDLTCYDYIKIFNPTNEPVVLDFYKLRTGWGNDNPGVNNTFTLSGTVQPGGYLTVVTRDDGKPFDITASGGYIWLEDIYGLVKYGNTVYKYPDLGGETYRGFSWAMNNSGEWQWAIPAPNQANDFSRRPKIKTTSKSLVPCKVGQERNPVTNRCRNSATAASALKPCRADQVRNPATNRCRSVTSAASLKPCTSGQERNPETNRCRKVAAASTSLPAIQDVQSTPDGRNYRWWIVGSIAGAIVTFAAWEWRRDIASWISRFKKSNGSPPT
jgi:hypothetical protein